MEPVWRELRFALSDKAFWVIAATMLLGLTGQTPWVIVPLTVLLAVCSVVFDPDWIELYRTGGRLDALAWFGLGSLGVNTLFIGAAFVLGASVRWLWW